METKHNPLVGFTVQFQDGCQLGLRVGRPVPQVKAMAALGQFAVQVGMGSVDFTLPRQPLELVAEAIEVFLAAQGDEETFPRELHEWSSHDMARAILDAVMMPELASVLFDACEAQHRGLDLLFARLIEVDKDFRPSQSGQPWEAAVKGNAAIQMARPIMEQRQESEDGK